MTSPLRTLQPVSIDDLPEYPISAEDRLDSHFFIQWNLKRWRKSSFRNLAEPEIGWFGFLLFCESHDETPVGTLPTDERLLARALGITVERWQSLCRRDITPLHNWSKVMCDNGEVRLAHPVVTEVALEALKSSRKNKSDRDDRRRAKRIKDLAEMIEKRIQAPQLLRNPGFVDQFNDWLETRYPETQRREPFIRTALSEFQVEAMS
ncbi:hypothetical protein [Paracoccus sulfuroxidans]|uniref:DUF1376 domain-containing protein n=1 Tax=Paracoccus sulfuroxidans TaxID=384678 RepID=A0A562NC91_9RHOB|nr:hypothetical protein [Paracoccus sulfuroxidans]TWI29723.1 hypothetical protein IQ24_03540 [Paracoccus sulfuroxidans]